MPDQLNKQSLINLLIDSPLREPIKINLIDIVNNTTDPDLPKVYSTITKELEIFQKATERRMKLADETIAKLGGAAPTSTPAPIPPLDLPPLPTTPTPMPAAPAAPSTINDLPSTPPLSVPPLDLPPLPTSPVMPPTPQALHVESDSSREMTPGAQQPGSPAPLGGSTSAPDADEAALAEIQKELDSLKTSAVADAQPAPTPVPAQ